MYVCICHALNDRDVEKAKCDGACRAGDIHRHYGVKVQCGRCLPMIRQLLDTDKKDGAG